MQKMQELMRLERLPPWTPRMDVSFVMVVVRLFSGGVWCAGGPRRIGWLGDSGIVPVQVEDTIGGFWLLFLRVGYHGVFVLFVAEGAVGKLGQHSAFGVFGVAGGELVQLSPEWLVVVGGLALAVEAVLAAVGGVAGSLPGGLKPLCVAEGVAPLRFGGLQQVGDGGCSGVCGLVFFLLDGHGYVAEVGDGHAGELASGDQVIHVALDGGDYGCLQCLVGVGQNE